MIRLIASDVDGTLLQHGATEIDPELFTIIPKLKEKGIHFVVASGRPLPSLQHLFAPVLDDISFVGENGTIYILNNQIHTPKTFDKELVHDIIAAVREDEGCEVMFSCAKTVYLEPKNEEFFQHLQSVVKFKLTPTDDLLSVEELPIKIALCNQNGVNSMIAKYKTLFEDRATVVTSGNLWMDFMPLGSNKGVAISHIATELGIEPHECMAFGDQWNDAEMLRSAGTSFAMNTAVPGIADFCTHTTDSVVNELRKLL